MEQGNPTQLQEPRIERIQELTIIGSSRSYTVGEAFEIPTQWLSFAPRISNITNELDPVTYGVIYNGFERYGDSFDPMSGNGGLEVWIPIVQ